MNLNKYSVQLKLLILFLWGTMFLSSCITSKKTNYLQETNYKVKQYNDSATFEDYRFQKGDKLYIRVFSIDPENSLLFNGTAQTGMLASGAGGENMDLMTYMIDNEGYIQLPTNRKVKLLYLTTREAKQAIKETIQPVFKDKPVVDVKIVGRYFSIIGTSNNGRYPITKEKMNIFQAIALAGDIGTFGDRSRIKLIRETNGKTIVKEFDIRGKNIINSEFYYIQPNDVIYVQDVKEQFFAVTNFATALSTVFSTISFGLFFYNLFKTKPQ